jgi:phosphoglycerate dehydrogenase-like enzyme
MNTKVTSVAFSNNGELVRILASNFSQYSINYENKRFTKNELIEYLVDADAAIIGLDKIDMEVLSKLPRLKVISKYGVGLDNIDLEQCKLHNVAVKWTPGVNKTSVAEMTLGFMLMLSRNLYYTSNQLKKGIWNKSGGYQLSNKKVGVIGLGNIGKELIRFLNPFNCEIYGNDIIEMNEYAQKNNIHLAEKKELFAHCDIITIHTPLTTETKYMINSEVLDVMKSDAAIINTARGDIINLKDLKEALDNNKIKGAAIDVYDQEPPQDSELLKLPTLINTPHIGGNSKEAVFRMGKAAIDHIINFRNLNNK